MNRNFKGVWIPKNIWLNKTLTWMEKLFLVEIDSLNNENGCFASNAYFSEFFQLSKQRCSQIINKLLEKKAINISYEYEGKEIKKRVICIDEGYQIFFRGYQENAKDNNTINNTLFNKLNNKKTSKKEVLKSKEVLEYEESMDITKYCLDTFYKIYKQLHPKTREKSFYKQEKIFKLEKLITYFIKGFPISNHNDLRLFISKKEISFNMINGFGNIEEFKEAFNKAINIYQQDYDPVNKDKLPSHPLQFLYNSFGEFKSYFLYFYYNPVKKIKIEKLRKDKHPEILKKYKKLIYGNTDLSVSKTNLLISYISNIVKEYEKLTKIKIEIDGKVYNRIDFESDNYILYMSSLQKFINIHIDYLEAIKEHKALNINYIYVSGYYWDQFIQFLKNKHNVDLYNSKAKLIKKCKHFIKFS